MKEGQKMATFRDYVAILQAEPHLGHYTRLDEAAPGNWLYTAYAGMDAVLPLPTLNVRLPLGEIHEGIEFPPPGRTLNKKHPLHGKIF